MIRKLRLKFILINMTIVTILLGCIGSLTYGFTRSELESESIRMMQRIAAAPFRKQAQLQRDDEMHLPYFVIRFSPDGEQMAIGGGYYDLTNEQIEQLLEQYRNSPERMGVIPEYNLRFCRVDAPHSQYLVFTDISSEIHTLQSLLRTVLLIGVLGFFGFLAASIGLSYWAIRPVEQAFRAQQQFVADASHELKTPLTVIRTNAQIMESYPDHEQMRQSSLSNILTMSDQMRVLIEQMLTLARNDHDCGSAPTQSVELSHLSEQTALPFESVFFENGMTLETEVEPGIQVKGDPDDLRRLLEILLDNACKYASPGGRTWVTLRRISRHRCRLTVADEGPQMDRQQLDSCFDRFSTGDAARNRRGSYGLGLAIARSIAEKHRGSLRAESRDGINSFFLDLPIS